ncbi:MAG: hypothetical protein GTO40_28615, partial [Deltaproteobacteria bacterium]|nr:hypothetical protein [Deltaproteobacteria bacterium]
MGYNWEFSYHKRLLPTGGVLKENGIKVEDAMFPSPIKYMDGTGRVDMYLPVGFPQVQTVRNYGHQFKALVQYFKGPKGKFNVLQRYVVLPGSKPPKSIASHENWEGQIFYVMRYKDDFKEIYSCRGMLLWLKDRHTNFLKFLYDVTFNPVTQNLRLREVE